MSLSNKTLKSFQLPDLDNVYNIPEIADEYTSKKYDVGDYVNYQGVIYRCTTQISVAEAWNGSHWTAVKIANDIRDNKNELTDLKSAFDSFTQNGTTHIGVSKFAKGTLENDGTINSAQAYAVSNNVDVQFGYPVRISVREGYQYALCYKLGESSYGIGSLVTHDEYIPANTVFRLKILKNPLAYREADIELFSKQIDILSYDRAKVLYHDAEIDQLKTGNELINAVFRRGSIYNGSYVSYVKYRIATKTSFTTDREITLKAKTGFKFAVVTYQDDETYTDTGWKTSLTIPENSTIGIVIARSTEDTSEVANVFEFYTAVCAQTPFLQYVDEEIARGGLTDKKNALNFSPLTNGKSRILAHTGYHTTYPENTLPAFREAGRLKYWGIESDINQTSDGYFVMIHDTTLDRTTTGTGYVNEHTLEQIRSLSIKNYPDLKVPTLEEYLAVCKRYGCVPFLEFKATVTDYNGVVEVLKKYELDKLSAVSGSKWNASAFRAINDYIPYFGIYQYGLNYDFETELNYIKNYKPCGMCWDKQYGYTSEQIETLHDENMMINIFQTETDTQVFDAFACYTDLVTTDTITPEG